MESLWKLSGMYILSNALIIIKIANLTTFLYTFFHLLFIFLHELLHRF